MDRVQQIKFDKIDKYVDCINKEGWGMCIAFDHLNIDGKNTKFPWGFWKGFNIDVQSKYELKNQHIYEIIREHKKAKIMFDIDGDEKQGFSKEFILDEIKTKNYLEKAKQFIYQEFPEADIVVVDSSYKDKFSYHLILNNYYVENFTDLKEYVIHLSKKYDIKLDIKIYSANRNMRMVFQSKLGKQAVCRIISNHQPIDTYITFAKKWAEKILVVPKEYFSEITILDKQQKIKIAPQMTHNKKSIKKDVVKIQFQNDDKKIYISAIQKIAQNLPPLDDYDMWVYTGMALKNIGYAIDHDFKQEFLLASQKDYPKYNEDLTLYKWDSFSEQESNLDQSYILKLLKKHNEKFYKKFMQTTEFFVLAKYHSKNVLEPIQEIYDQDHIEIDKFIEPQHLTNKKFHLLHNNTGSGKTELVKTWCEQNPTKKVLIIGNAQTLTYDQKNRFGDNFIHYQDKFCSRLYAEEDFQGIISCINSIYKFDGFHFDMIFFDEFQLDISQLYSLEKNKFFNFIQAIKLLIENAKIVILAQFMGVCNTIFKLLDIKKEDVSFYKSANPIQVDTFEYPSKGLFFAQIKKDLDEQKNIVVFTETFENKIFEETLKQKPFYINKDNSQEIMKNGLQEFLEKQQFSVISPAITSGCDLKLPNHCVYLFVNEKSRFLSFAQLIQQVTRNRSITQIKVFAGKVKNIYNFRSIEEEVDSKMYSLKKYYSSVNFTEQDKAHIEFKIIQKKMIHFNRDLLVHCFKNNFKSYTLVTEGSGITVVQPEIIPKMIPSLFEIMTQISQGDISNCQFENNKISIIPKFQNERKYLRDEAIVIANFVFNHQKYFAQIFHLAIQDSEDQDYLKNYMNPIRTFYSYQRFTEDQFCSIFQDYVLFDSHDRIIENTFQTQECTLLSKKRINPISFLKLTDEQQSVKINNLKIKKDQLQKIRNCCRLFDLPILQAVFEIEFTNIEISCLVDNQTTKYTIQQYMNLDKNFKGRNVTEPKIKYKKFFEQSIEKIQINKIHERITKYLE